MSDDKLLESIDKRLMMLDEKIDNLVSSDHCDSVRFQCHQCNDSKFSDLYDKYNAIIAICTSIETTQKLQKPTNVKDELVLITWGAFSGFIKSNRFAQIVVIALLVNSIDIFTAAMINLYYIARSYLS
jgi:hypothetical protein